jgi:hypothetical protein
MAYCIDGEWYAHNDYKYNSFSECYAEMTENKMLTKNSNFRCLWAYDEYLENLLLVTPDNINQFINEEL